MLTKIKKGFEVLELLEKAKELNFCCSHIYISYDKDILDDQMKKFELFEQIRQLNYKYRDGFIYLIREREFLDKKMDVYKIGCTIQKTASLQLKRLKDYKKGSQLLCACRCNPEIVFDIEAKIKEIFGIKFNKHNDGTEYFIGNPNEMLKIIYETILSMDKQTIKNIKLTNEVLINNNNINGKIKMTPCDVANMFVWKYAGIIKSCQDRTIIYRFNNTQHKWKKIDHPKIFLEKLISKHMNVMINLNENKKSCFNNSEYISNYNSQGEYISVLTGLISSKHNMKNIIAQVLYLITDENFLEEMNSKTHIICFNNGVYDLKTNKLRKGKSTDCITEGLNYDYVEIESDKSYNHLLFGFIPEYTIGKYLIEILSLCLYEPENINYYFICGKGFIIKKIRKIIKYVFVDYINLINADDLTELNSKKPKKKYSCPQLKTT